MELTKLPESYQGKKKLKAILLGADPTNKGVRGKPGLIILDTVFGIDSYEWERYFFSPQKINLSAIGIDKDDLYVQNVCRNYFNEETSNNKVWIQIARVWMPFLVEELSHLDSKLPILATAEKIMQFLILKVPPAKDIYKMDKEPDFYSTMLKRVVYPLYRNPKYYLSYRYPEYRDFLRRKINE